jgi:hypothetical protein
VETDGSIGSDIAQPRSGSALGEWRLPHQSLSGHRDMADGEPAYLSPGPMGQFKFTIARLAKRNMRA